MRLRTGILAAAFLVAGCSLQYSDSGARKEASIGSSGSAASGSGGATSASTSTTSSASSSSTSSASSSTSSASSSASSASSSTSSASSSASGSSSGSTTGATSGSASSGSTSSSTGSTNSASSTSSGTTSTSGSASSSSSSSSSGSSGSGTASSSSSSSGSSGSTGTTATFPARLLDTDAGLNALALDYNQDVVAVGGSAETWQFMFLLGLDGGTWVQNVDMLGQVGSVVPDAPRAVDFGNYDDSSLTAATSRSGTVVMAHFIVPADGGDLGLDWAIPDSGAQLHGVLEVHGYSTALVDAAASSSLLWLWNGLGSGFTEATGLDGGAGDPLYMAKAGTELFTLDFSGVISHFNFGTLRSQEAFTLDGGTWNAFNNVPGGYGLVACRGIDGAWANLGYGTFLDGGAGLTFYGLQPFGKGNVIVLDCAVTGDYPTTYAALWRDALTYDVHVSRLDPDGGVEDLDLDGGDDVVTMNAVGHQIVMRNSGEVFFLTSKGLYDWPASSP